MQALGRPGEAPEQCPPEVMHDIIQQHLDSPAMWAIFPLQVWNISELLFWHP